MNHKNDGENFLSLVDTLALDAAETINTLFEKIQKKHNLSECATYQVNRLQPLVLALVLNGYEDVDQPNHPVSEFLEIASKFSIKTSKTTDERYKFLSLTIGNIVYIHTNPYESFRNASRCLNNHEKDIVLAKYTELPAPTRRFQQTYTLDVNVV